MRSGCQPGGGRAAAKAETRQGWDDDVEGVRRASAVRGGVGERIDDLELLDDRSRPAVRHDSRQRVWMARSNVNEMDVEAIDFGHELRQRIEPRFDVSPVVIAAPVAGELLKLPKLNTLRAITDRLHVGPAGRGDAPAQIDELLVGNVDMERANGIARGSSRRMSGKKARGTGNRKCHPNGG